MISQGLANLLDNAFKYTPTHVAVSVALSQENDHVVLTVMDHGKGIPAQEHIRMTERFVRGDTARTQTGSGLGLALVKAVMQAHGGSLEIADTPGGGLTVRLKLPLA